MRGVFRPIEAGERFGRLVVAQSRGRGEATVRCRCDCGAEVNVVARRLGHHTNSCGCLHREFTAALAYRHGMSKTPIFRLWAEMIARCSRPSHARYADYGGRGITVCERWKAFENFYADMGDRPEGRSLDRINNDLGYSPGNCRWATASEQGYNRRPVLVCRHGHDLTPENTYVAKNGKRQCRECNLRRSAEARTRKALDQATS